MHLTRNESRKSNGPETEGITIHSAAHYDLFTTLAGMGAGARNSRMVIELADIQPGESVLDVGCGTGNLTLTAQSAAGAQGAVYGIDAAPEMIELAEEKAARAGQPVHFQVGLIEKLDFPNERFDAVITRLAIHHLPDDLKRAGFREILRVLKPGGRLLIADYLPPQNPLLRHLSSLFVGGHMMETDVWKLPAMLEAAGFLDVQSGRTRSVILAYVRGRKPASH